MRQGRLTVQQDSEDQGLWQEINIELHKERAYITFHLLLRLGVFEHLMTFQELLGGLQIYSVSRLHEKYSLPDHTSG